MNTVFGINGPVVTVLGNTGLSMMEMVLVGEEKLVGEVIGITAKATTIQVYENTTGLKVGEPVYATGGPLCATLGPGILDNIFDGIERPLKAIEKLSGDFINRGVSVPSIDADKLWEVTVLVKAGDTLHPGDVYATCPETPIITHKCMVPPQLYGTVKAVKPSGAYKVNDTVVTITDEDGLDHDLTLCQQWPIRTPRPVASRKYADAPLITGQRVIDTLFPLAKGGTAAIPGGFGTGLIANTSNMPVAAREASIYTGITLAEYYRDMGYHVAIMADSTSRWAEALREISGRLEEMPAEEGFPAYLPSRLSEFYERAGMVEPLGGGSGSVTIIGAVSPQGSDFSEPVTQNTKRFVRCFLALDKSLAYARHYPAINWTMSYSEYYEDLDPYYTEHLGEKFCTMRGRILGLLSEENKLMEIVKLIGSDVLPDSQKVVIETARVIRTGFLQQNAFHKNDTYVPLDKQMWMMEAILHLYDRAVELVDKGVPVSAMAEAGLFDKLVKVKYEIPNDKPEMFGEYNKELDDMCAQLLAKQTPAAG